MEETDTSNELEQRIVYRLPRMEQAIVRKNILYKSIEDIELKLDLYYPEGYDEKSPLPAVIFVHGDGPVERLRDIKDTGQYVGWGQLTAASGLIAVTANHRSTETLHNVVGVANDVDDLISYVRDHAEELHIDAERLGIWACSAGGYIGMRAALLETPPYIRALACYYGFTELQAYYTALYSREYGDITGPPLFDDDDFAEFSASEMLLRRIHQVAPILIARAGMDYPILNEALDSFIDEAIGQNVALTLMNHPTGQHGFDVLDNDPRSHEIIQATLEFFRTHLIE